MTPLHITNPLFFESPKFLQPSITIEAVERTRNHLKRIFDNQKPRRKIKQYVTVDSNDDSLISSGSSSCISDYNCDDDDVFIVDHADGELNRGTLEIWTQKKSIFNRREKIRKIKKYKKNEKILYNSSFFRSLDEADQQNTVSSIRINENEHLTMSEPNSQQNTAEHNFSITCDEGETQCATQCVTTSTPVKSTLLKESNDTNITFSSPIVNCELVEIFDTYENMKVQCIEERGPVETEIIDHVDITNVYEDIHLEDHGTGDCSIALEESSPRSNSIRSRLSSNSSMNRSRLNSNSTAVRGTSVSSEYSFRMLAGDNNNETSKWESNSAIAEEFSKIDFDHTVYLFEDEYVIIDYHNDQIFCRDQKSSSLLLFVQ